MILIFGFKLLHPQFHRGSSSCGSQRSKKCAFAIRRFHLCREASVLSLRLLCHAERGLFSSLTLAKSFTQIHTGNCGCIKSPATTNKSLTNSPRAPPPHTHKKNPSKELFVYQHFATTILWACEWPCVKGRVTGKYFTAERFNIKTSWQLLSVCVYLIVSKINAKCWP